MSDRGVVPWVAGLVVVALASAGVGTWLVWWGADLTIQLDDFYQSIASSSAQTPDSVYEFWNRISVNAYTLQVVAGPLFTGATIATLTVFAVLARRWDRAERA